MSTIDNYNHVLKQYENMVTELNFSQHIGPNKIYDPRHIDKAACRLYKIGNNKYEFELYHGFYGSSSCYYSTDEFTLKYLVEAINDNIKIIINDALIKAKADVLQAKEDAKDEALNVLKNID